MDYIKQRLLVAEELESKNGYTWTLVSRLGEALHLAEQLFGERDKSYTILGVEFVLADRPQIWYPGNRKHVIIQLSANSLLDEFQALYQLAHETIHLLSPLGNKSANILEEGLATYFSEWYLNRLGQTKWKPELQKYQEALDLTKSLLRIDNGIVKKVREIEPIISNLMPEHFLQMNSQVSTELLTKLCSTFQ